MKELMIDKTLFKMALGRDVDFHDSSPQSTYLDRVTGDIFWLYDEDYDATMDGLDPDENRAKREMISANPGGYIKVEGLSHGDHHSILRAFLESDWTDDTLAKNRAITAYERSIGRWMKSVDDEAAVNGYRKFLENRLDELAEEFLRSHEITPKWR